MAPPHDLKFPPPQKAPLAGDQVFDIQTFGDIPFSNHDTGMKTREEPRHSRQIMRAYSVTRQKVFYKIL